MTKILRIRSDGIAQHYNVKSIKDYTAIGKHNGRNVYGKIIKEPERIREPEVIEPINNIQLTAHLRSDNYGQEGHAISFRASITEILSGDTSKPEVDLWFKMRKHEMKTKALRYGFSLALINAIFGEEIEERIEDSEENIGSHEENFQYSRDGKRWINF